jgi:hypothetical protein
MLLLLDWVESKVDKPATINYLDPAFGIASTMLVRTHLAYIKDFGHPAEDISNISCGKSFLYF